MAQLPIFRKINKQLLPWFSFDTILTVSPRGRKACVYKDLSIHVLGSLLERHKHDIAHFSPLNGGRINISCYIHTIKSFAARTNKNYNYLYMLEHG